MKRSILIVLTLMIIPTSSWADLYLRPRAGAVIPVNGNDISYTLGGALGYQWTSFLATELSYARVLGTSGNASGDLLSAQAVASLPMPIITPYASAGVGLSHYSLGPVSQWDMMYLLGAGAMLDVIPFISVGLGVTYAIVQNQPDFVEPVIILSLRF